MTPDWRDVVDVSCDEAAVAAWRLIVGRYWPHPWCGGVTVDLAKNLVAVRCRCGESFGIPLL